MAGRIRFEDNFPTPNLNGFDFEQAVNYDTVEFRSKLIAPLYDNGGTVYQPLVKADGVTDDAPEILSKIAALPAAGGTIVLPAGRIVIGSELGITKSNVTLEGQGNATEIYVKNGANLRSAIAITGTGVVEVKVRKLQINGNRANQSNGDGIYISTPWTSNTNDTQHTFEDLQIQNCKNNGVEVAAASDSRVLQFTRVRIRKCDGNGFYLPAPSCTDSTFYDCIAETIGLNGFYLGCLNSHFTDCKVFYCGSAGGNNHGFKVLGYNNYFTTCEAQDNYQSGFYVVDGGDVTYGAQGNVFTSCIGDSNGHNGGSPYAVGLQIVNTNNTQIRGGIYMTRPYPDFTQRIGVSVEGTSTGTTATGIQGTGNSSSLYSDTSTGVNIYTPTPAPFDIDTTTVTPKVVRLRHGFTNFTPNASFNYWPGAASSTPPGWVLTGDATILRSTDTTIGNYSAEVTFGTANTGELYTIYGISNLVDYVASGYAKRISGTGTARIVFQRHDSPYTEYVSIGLTAAGSFQPAEITGKPSAGTQMRVSFKSADTNASTWRFSEIQFEESKGVATAFSYAPIDDSTNQTVYGQKTFAQPIITATQTPASAAAAGTAGTIVWDANYIYICTGPNQWRRVAIATW